MRRVKKSPRQFFDRVTKELGAVLRKVGPGISEKLEHEVVATVPYGDYLYVLTRVPRSTKRLSTRESEITELVRNGLGNREIAERLEISPATVASHLQRIFRKLDVHNRTELIGKVTLLS